MRPENRPKILFDGKEYDDYQATQMQRSIEQEIRKQKRRKTAYEAAGLKDDATAANIKLRRLNQKYREFSKAAGLPEQRDRMKVLYSDKSSEKYVQKAASVEKLKEELSDNPSTVLQTTLDVNSEIVKGVLPKGAKIEDLRIIAGGSSETAVKVAQYLSETYGGEPLQWIKMGGIIKTDNFLYDVHWFELDGRHYDEKLKGVKKNEG